MLQLVFATCSTKTVEGENEIAFGLNNGLPWGRISQDLKNFRARTENTVMIMGAKTWQSFQSPLPGRRSIVVVGSLRGKPQTKNGTYPSEIMFEDEFERFLRGDVIITATATKEYPWNTTVCRETDDVSIIGGKKLIEQAITHVDRIVHTNIIKDHRVNSDVQMPLELIIGYRSRCKMIENHWYQCDDVTQIIEGVYVPKDL